MVISVIWDLTSPVLRLTATRNRMPQVAVQRSTSDVQSHITRVTIYPSYRMTVQFFMKQ